MGNKNTRTVTVPEGVQVTINEKTVTVKGSKGEVTRELSYPYVTMKQEGNTITVQNEKDTVKGNAVAGTFGAHLKGLIKGVNEGFVYKLKAVYAHFPMTVKQKEDQVEITNFLGEKAARHAKIVGGTTVKIEKEMITLEGLNKEEVGQTAGNLEKATKVTKRDSRVFQDGIYIVSKK